LEECKEIDNKEFIKNSKIIEAALYSFAPNIQNEAKADMLFLRRSQLEIKKEDVKKIEVGNYGN